MGVCSICNPIAAVAAEEATAAAAAAAAAVAEEAASAASAAAAAAAGGGRERGRQYPHPPGLPIRRMCGKVHRDLSDAIGPIAAM